MSSKNFQKIIQFYLFECPARSIHMEDKKGNEPRTEAQPIPKKRFSYGRCISRKGITLPERGFEGGKMLTLLSAMKRVAGGQFVLATGEDADMPLAKEFIWLKSKYFVTEGIFRFIRNSFAHAEFEISNGWYDLKNTSGDQLKGRAVLREKTLLKWIELVDMSIEELKQIGRLQS